MKIKKRKDGKSMNKFTYDIVKNDYTGEYVVFKNCEERFIAKGIFHSPSRKECVEWLKTYKNNLKNGKE